MNLRTLGHSDLHISPVGFGAWAIGGGGWQYAWGSQDDADAIAAIHQALDLGVNWIDTAPVYGLGHSEEVVGRALKAYGGAKPYVFTKCVLVWDEPGSPIVRSFEPASLRRECETSLQRLGVEAIDLYQMHWPPQDDIARLDAAWETLERLRDEGKVRWIGVSNFSPAQMDRVRAIASVTSLQPPYSLLRRGVEAELLPYAQQHGLGVIVYSPMLSGMLTGAMTKARAEAFPADDWRRNNKEFQEPRLSQNLAFVEVLREVGAPHDRSPGEVAIAWTLRHPAVTGAIVGARSAEQARGVMTAGGFALSDDEAARIEAAIPV